MASKLYLIDGHALVFKMYYAFLRRPMINSKGVDTSIIFGFTKYILELIEKQQPTHIAVAFDPPGGTFRNELYPEYKANRPETPQLVIDALEPLIQICKALNIPVLMERGFEADDVIGSMAKRCASEGLDVYMVTPDKDYGQLIDNHIWQVKPGRGGVDDEIVGVSEICERYGIQSPMQVIDMLTICGDVADNVPGVRGVGEIGAGKLVSYFGSVEKIYEHISELSYKQKVMFEEARPHIQLSKELVTIRTDIKLDVKTEDMALDKNYPPVLADLFEKYEFTSLNKYVGIETKPKSVIQVREIPPRQIQQCACLAGKCSVSLDGEQVVVSTIDRGEPVAARGSFSELRYLLEDSAVVKYCFDMKALLHSFSREGKVLAGKLRDVELIHYLLDPEKSHNIDVLSQSYLGQDIQDVPRDFSVGSLFEEVKEDSGDALRRAAAIFLVGLKVWNQLHEASLVSLYEKIEYPLSRVLEEMENTGVKIDPRPLAVFADHLREDMAHNESLVREISGEPTLNVSSPKQLGEVLFEKMSIDPSAKKGRKKSWPTDEETLVQYREDNPIIDAILEYRSTKKLLSTYIEPLQGFISPVTGRVHTTFNQALTSTGRLSSSNPNLQNIPVRTDRGREIRKAFVPENPEWFIMSADYSQVELRIMAHLSCDEHLISAFRRGVDIHSATASKIFKLPLDLVTPEHRRIAKTANFGIMYGISAFGLAQRLRIPRSDAKQIIDDYFASFPAISSFIETTLTAARETGYVETIFGRRRYIPDINSKNATIRSLAERNAINAPIQGSAADIIKIAMVRVASRMKEEHLKSMMVLQVHDELMFEVHPKEIEILKQIVVSEMENVKQLSIPLTVDCKYGKNWLEAH